MKPKLHAATKTNPEAAFIIDPIMSDLNRNRATNNKVIFAGSPWQNC